MNLSGIKRMIITGFCLTFLLSLTACSRNSIIPEKTSETTSSYDSEVPVISLLLTPPVEAQEFKNLEKYLPRIAYAVEDMVLHDLGIRLKITLKQTRAGNIRVDPHQFFLSGDYDIMAAEGYTSLNSFVEQDLLLDMKPYLQNDGNDILNSYESPELVTRYEIAGGLYGLPAHVSIAKFPAVIFNKDLFTYYGFNASEIRSFADIDAVYQKIAASEPGIYMTQIHPVTAYNQPAISYVSLLSGHDPFAALSGDIENDTDVCCIYETEEFQEWANYLCQWDLKGWLHPDSFTDTATLYELIGKGEVFSLYLPEYDPSMLSDLEVLCANKLIAVPLGDPVIDASLLKKRFYWVISASCRYPESAVRVLEYMNTSKAFMTLLNWGQEDLDYVTTDDYLLDFPPDSREELWHLNEGNYLLNQYLLTPWTGHDPYLYDNIQHYGKTALRPKLLGFEFDASPVQEEFIACRSVFDQMLNNAVLQSRFPGTDEFMGMINEMHGLKLDRIIDECQEQADAFLAGEYP